MSFFNKFKLFNFEITLDNAETLVNYIKSIWANNKMPETGFRIVTFNPEMLIATRQNKEFQKSVQVADAIIPDGIGLVWLLRKKGAKQVQRLAGIDLAWKLLTEAIKADLPISLIGSTDEVLKKSIENINDKLGKANLIYAHNGFFNDSQQVQITNVLLEIQPKFLLVAMPFIKQEIFLADLYTKGFKGVAMGVGGSFDVWANLVERAPVFMQKFGLEWFWRLIKQPERFQRLMQTFIPFSKIYFLNE
jgi:N-acetylglucosaminyldiphosphoundecaprenol N-acetyl-beta-D-mannosaminyltransferase